MTVGEFKKLIENVPDDYLVVCAGDSEGNDFYTVVAVETNAMYKYRAFGYAELTDKLIADGFTEEDIMTDGQRCIVIWP